MQSSEGKCPDGQCDRWFRDGDGSGDDDRYFRQLQDIAQLHVLKEVEVRRGHIAGHWELGLKGYGQCVPLEQLAALAFEAGCEVIAPELSMDRQ
eukprot:13972-Eustigmatos_ZCMA.PRE.1